MSKSVVEPYIISVCTHDSYNSAFTNTQKKLHKTLQYIQSRLITSPTTRTVKTRKRQKQKRKRPQQVKGLRPFGELKDLKDDIKTCWDLPNEKKNIETVQRNVQIPRRLIPFLHGRHQSSCSSPQHRYPCNHHHHFKF